METIIGESSYAVMEMPKAKLTVTVQADLMSWVDEEVAKGHFADRSHAVQYSLLKVKELVQKGEIKF